jgi:hypothetical protein
MQAQRPGRFSFSMKERATLCVLMKETCVVLNFGNHQQPIKVKRAAVTWWETTNIATTSGSIETTGWMC